MRPADIGFLVLLTAGPIACGRTPDAREMDARTSHVSAGALIAAGERQYTADSYDAARALWTRALATSDASHDEINRARAITWLGLVSGRLGEPQASRRLGEEALAIKIRLNLVGELSSSYHALGLAALDANRNEDARKLFTDALEAARKAGDIKGEAKALGGLGLAYAYLGDLVRSRENQRAQRLAAKRIGDHRLEANSMANEAMVDIWEGNALPAIALLDTSRGLYRRERFAAGEQNALGQLATAYELTGREDLALAALDSSLIISRRIGLAEQEADLLRLIGGVHLRLGDYREALTTFTRAESMMRARGLDANLGAALRGIAEAHFRLANMPRAGDALEKALRVHAASSEPLEQLDDLLLATDIDYRLAGPRRAAGRLEEARALSARINTRGARLAVVLAEAHLADLRKDSRRVLRVLGSAAPDFIWGDPGTEWIVNALKARAHGRLHELDSARAAGQRAVAAVDRLRGTLASEALRSTYIADRAEVYGDLVVTLLELGRTEDAFNVSDAARSQNLLEHLASTSAYTTSGVIPSEIAAEERLLRRIDELVQRLRATVRSHERGGSSGAAPSRDEAQLAEARSEYESLVARARQGNSRATAILGARQVRLREVRASLAPDEALIEYMLISGRLLAFVATRDTLRVTSHELNGDALVQQVRLLADLWGRNDANWEIGLAASRKLYTTLVTPALATGALRGVRHLVIVPHGILGEIPFAALKDDVTDRFLVQDFSVTNLPTAASLPPLRQEKSSQRGDYLGGVGFAPFNGRKELPATEPEVEAFRRSGPRRFTRLGRDATEARLRVALGQKGIIHVATHGVMNLRSPLFSRVELASMPGTSPDDNGRLEIHEVLGLPIRSSLVFLSGCETGAGLEWLNDPVRGTGDLTLAQAVLSAGAANVITTLWRIADVGGARFAETFYVNLRTLPLADAFAATQRAMAASGQYRSPYYWAGYVLAGEGRFAAHPQVGPLASVPVISTPHSNAPLTDRYKP